MSPEQPRSHATSPTGVGNVFGVPGASLTWGISGADRGDVTAGIEGERMVGKVLNAYAAEHTDITVAHSVRWPGNTSGDTDHVVMVGGRVLLLDAKRWKAKRKYSVTPRGAVMRGTVRFPEGKVKMLPALQSWREVLPRGTVVSGVVVVAQRQVYVPYDANWQKAPFRLVTVERLVEYLDRWRGVPVTPEGLALEPRVAAAVLERVIAPKPGPKRLYFGR